MNYVLIKASDLAEVLPLCCSPKTNLDLQAVVQSIGLGNDSDVSSPLLESIVFKYIEDIDFASLHRILNHPKLKNLLQPEVLLGLYEIPLTIQVLKTLERASLWTPEILNWLNLKKIKPQEISFLNLQYAHECTLLLESATRSLLSKMDTLNLLEMASDLMLMKIDIAAALKSNWTEVTLLEITSLRYPVNFTFNPLPKA